MKNIVFVFSILITLALFQRNPVQAQTIERIKGEEILLTNYTTSWIGNDGGWEEVHIPHDMLNMFVSDDGTVATICSWDEGGTNVGVFKDGKLISRPEGSGTGGWGRFSGSAVALDDNYVYQLLSQHGCDGGNSDLNINGLPQFPPCDEKYEWKTIRRYDIQTGLGAPFEGGYGYKGDMLVVCWERDRNLTGLAVDDNNLYVAVTGSGAQNQPDSIKIYNRRTMSYQSGYAVKGGTGHLCCDRKGGLWMMQGREIIRLNAADGKILKQRLTLSEGVVANCFSIDNHNDRLLLPNSGVDMNVLIYHDIYNQPRLYTTFGKTGGVFAADEDHLEGETGELRFIGPTAAGVDANGNIYVANTTVSNGRGAVIEAYNEKTKSRLWKCEGLIFTATADFKRDDLHYFYSPEKIHRIDYGKSGGRLDEFVALTVNPFRFPDDERIRKDGGFITSCFKRSIEGKDFFVCFRYVWRIVGGYRFDKPNYGYIGIPCFFLNNGDPDKQIPIPMWLDDNGDGKRQESEYRYYPEINQYSMSMFVDKVGNIWRGTRGQGFFFWKLKGLNEHGVPQYDDPVLYPLPENFSDAKRIYYNPSTDELFLAGFSPQYPDKKDTWWAMGSTIVRCDRFLERAAKNEIVKGWKPDLIFYIPFNIEDGSKLDYDNAKAFAAEGDYIFIAIARYGYITVYDKSTGKLVGRIEPGDNVHKQSGWCDFNYAINVMQREDGSYLILHEENAFAKILCYS